MDGSALLCSGYLHVLRSCYGLQLWNVRAHSVLEVERHTHEKCVLEWLKRTRELARNLLYAFK